MSAAAVAGVLCGRIAALGAASAPPVFVALDGPVGSGKIHRGEPGGSAGCCARDRRRRLLPRGDDAFWDAMGPAEKVDLVIDWRRQRAVLERVRRGAGARWRPYD